MSLDQLDIRLDAKRTDIRKLMNSKHLYAHERSSIPNGAGAMVQWFCTLFSSTRSHDPNYPKYVAIFNWLVGNFSLIISYYVPRSSKYNESFRNYRILNA